MTLEPHVKPGFLREFYEIEVLYLQSCIDNPF